MLRSKFSSRVFNLSRRDFIRSAGAVGAYALVENQLLAQVFTDERHISRLAAQPPSMEGTWTPPKIEGQIPRDLNGTLYRMSKGQLSNHGVPLRHWFDGDAFLIKYSILDGNVTITARFIETPERRQETLAGRMIYREYGTVPPVVPSPYKNQPNINVIFFDGRLLGLSEAFHPTSIDPETLAYQGPWDFYGSLPANVAFTAHPKFDASGVGYTFGTNNGIDWALMVYRMESSGTLTQIGKVALPGYFMVHDMLVGSEHLVFIVPPVQYDFVTLLSGTVAAADVLHYMENTPTRVIVMRKDGAGEPLIMEQPPGMVYHHGNLAEAGDRLSFHSLMYPDGSVLTVFDSWSQDRWPSLQPNQLTEFSVDLSSHQVTQRVLAYGDEFPRFDTRKSGSLARYLYAIREDSNDPFSYPQIVRYDFVAGREHLVHVGSKRTLGEVVFVPHPGKIEETDGWLLNQGYDAQCNETFLDIRDAETLALEARIWTGQHLPLGFHGNFYSLR
jgi:all-trans-8'-apo-beta-carotenal 15,15'-oxygenase